MRAAWTRSSGGHILHLDLQRIERVRSTQRERDDTASAIADRVYGDASSAIPPRLCELPSHSDALLPMRSLPSLNHEYSRQLDC